MRLLVTLIAVLCMSGAPGGGAKPPGLDCPLPEDARSRAVSVRSRASVGSGYLLPDGRILTAAHVAQMDILLTTVIEGFEWTVVVERVVWREDLALLRVEGPRLEVADLPIATDVVSGQAGVFLSLRQSGVRPLVFRDVEGSARRAIRFSPHAVRGDSGAAVFDCSGHLVTVASSNTGHDTKDNGKVLFEPTATLGPSPQAIRAFLAGNANDGNLWDLPQAIQR